MSIRRKTNPLWGIILLAAAGIVLARSLGVLPETVFDLTVRAAPGLLVLVGAAFVLQDRIPFSGLIALLLSVAIVAVIGFTAYSTRESQTRDDTRQPIEQVIAPEVTLLRIRISALATGVDILSGDAGRVTGEYLGSADNQVDVLYEQLGDNSATLTLRESEPGEFPRLEAVGRGTLRLTLPVGVPLDVELLGQDGSVVLNMSGTSLERLNVNTRRGEVVVTLPEYEPLFSEQNELLGTLTTQQGDLTLFIPANVAARLELERGNSGLDPQHDPNVYNYLVVGDVLESREINTAAITVRYAVVVPAGRIRVEVPG